MTCQFRVPEHFLDFPNLHYKFEILADNNKNNLPALPITWRKESHRFKKKRARHVGPWYISFEKSRPRLQLCQLQPHDERGRFAHLLAHSFISNTPGIVCRRTYVSAFSYLRTAIIPLPTQICPSPLRRVHQLTNHQHAVQHRAQSAPQEANPPCFRTIWLFIHCGHALASQGAVLVTRREWEEADIHSGY